MFRCSDRNALPAPYYLFFFNDTATTEIYTLSLHDALPISGELEIKLRPPRRSALRVLLLLDVGGSMDPHAEVSERLFSACGSDRKSTRLNSSHTVISYAVFCLKKKKITYLALTEISTVRAD